MQDSEMEDWPSSQNKAQKIDDGMETTVETPGGGGDDGGGGEPTTPPDPPNDGMDFVPIEENNPNKTTTNDTMEEAVNSVSSPAKKSVAFLNDGDEDEARKAIDMLRGDDVAGRVSAVNRLESIASVLGEKRTREELIPFLTESVDDEDEVLVSLATALGLLIPYVGGDNYAHTLLPPLELLLTVEENKVREEAVKSTTSVARVLPDTVFQDQYAEMVSRLATKEWFTARMSACCLIANGFHRLTPEKQDTQVQQFSGLCHDDAPMVRRVASQNLGILFQNVVETIGPKALAPSGVVDIVLLPLYESLATNEQDSVRLQTTENCVAFGKAITSILSTDDKEEQQKILENCASLVKRVLPLVVATIDDRSWRVRWTAASKYADVVKAFTEVPTAADSLVPAYEKLLQDPEAEVRTAATFNLSEVAKCKALVKPNDSPNTDDSSSTDDKITVAERLVKRITGLTEDESEHVRAALATVATELAPILGKNATITHLVPPVLLLLRDAASEVRLNLIASLSSLNEVIGVDLLSQSLLPAILDLAEDGKWRIRLAIIHHIPLLARQMGKDFFSEQLSTLCVGWLKDDISTIRQAAANNLKELTSLFGGEWATVHLVPSIAEIRRHESYLRRLTALHACAEMTTAMSPDMARTWLLPMVLEMASDGVPNIRFNVAKALEKMAPACGRPVYEEQIRPVLSVLIEDPDRDVKYFAAKSLEAIEQEFGMPR